MLEVVDDEGEGEGEGDFGRVRALLAEAEIGPRRPKFQARLNDQHRGGLQAHWAVLPAQKHSPPQVSVSRASS